MTKDPFEGMAIPSELEASLQRHRRHLAELVKTLQMAGVSEAQIEQSVAGIVDSYRDELLRAIRAIRRQ